MDGRLGTSCKVAREMLLAVARGSRSLHKEERRNFNTWEMKSNLVCPCMGGEARTARHAQAVDWEEEGAYKAIESKEP